MNEEQATQKSNTQGFLIEYQEFLTSLKQGMADGRDVGLVIVKLANHFAIANTKYGEALIAYNAVASSIEQTVDEKGKAIASTKAKILSSATPESAVLIKAKITIESIVEVINSLKALQKGILYEQNSASIS